MGPQVSRFSETWAFAASPCRRWLCLWCPEVHFRYRAGPLRSRKVRRVRLESEICGKDAVRELMYVSVVVLKSVVVALALDRDAVFGACKFILQTQKIFARSQLRIIFGDRQQPSQRSVELAVSGNFVCWTAGRKQ